MLRAHASARRHGLRAFGLHRLDLALAAQLRQSVTAGAVSSDSLPNLGVTRPKIRLSAIEKGLCARTCADSAD